MIKYYCDLCQSNISRSDVLWDEHGNKCKECIKRLESMEEKYHKGIINKEKLVNSKKEYENSNIKTISEIYWCEKCNSPSFNKKCEFCGGECYYISTDVRPVFPVEQRLLDILTNYKYNIYGNSVWYTAGNQYILNGEKLPFSKTDLITKAGYDDKEIIKIRNEIYEFIIDENTNFFKEYFDENSNLHWYYKIIENFVKVNKKRLKLITLKAEEYIKKISKEYHEDEIYISFSGGKDSTVTHDLVINTLTDYKITRIFGDTTLEFPKTYEYIKRVKEATRGYQRPMRISKNRENNFYQMISKIGPPSRMMRWCCTYFKTGPISDKIDRSFSKKKKVLSFQGLRRSESISRSNYKKDSKSPKITKQKVSAPIIDWLDFDVWLYIFSNKIDTNDSYKLGYSRVGCWCCPNNGLWDEFLSKIYYPDLSKKFYSKLIDFSEKTNKNKIKDYVYNGKWKSRQGGNGLEISNNTFIESKECVDEENSFTFELTRKIEKDFYELFKPFGKLEYSNDRNNLVYILDKNDEIVMSLRGRVGQKRLKITIHSFNFGGLKSKIKNYKDAKNKIECQITKYQICSGCNGCSSICKYDAIQISKKNKKNSDFFQNISYKILDNKCIRCGECVDHFPRGCYMKKVLTIKNNSKEK